MVFLTNFEMNLVCRSMKRVVTGCWVYERIAPSTTHTVSTRNNKICQQPSTFWFYMSIAFIPFLLLVLRLWS